MHEAGRDRKNIEAFLKLDLPGTKMVIGTGPDLKMLKTKYPDAVFTGYKENGDLAKRWRPQTCSCFRAAPIPLVWG